MTQHSDARQALYFSCRRAGASFDVSGTHSCLLGHVIPRQDGSQDGIFAGWEWDGQTLTISHDRYGMYPLYYHATPTSIAIAPSVTTLIGLGAPKDIDVPAFAVFLRLGFFLRDDTPFLSIKACRPGGTHWPGGVDASWSPPISRALHIGRDAAMEAYLRVFRQAMGRRAPKHPAIVPLSGGRDSRHILFELLAQGHPPELCVTHEHFPPRHDEDVRIARLVAEAAGVRHQTVRQARSRLRAEIRKNLKTGFCTDEGAQILVLARFLTAMPDTTIYDGIGGDVLSAGLFLEPESHAAMTAGDFTALARRLTKKRQQQLEFVLRPAALSRFGWDLAVERTAEELAHHAKAPNPVGSFFFWNRTRREIALGPYQTLSGEVLAPYLDHDVYDLLSAIPADMLLDRTFHTDVIRQGYPQYADLPFEDSSVPDLTAPWFHRQFAAELAGYLLRPPRSRLLRLPRILPRLFRCALVGDFRSIEWMDPVLLTYTSALERFLVIE